MHVGNQAKNLCNNREKGILSKAYPRPSGLAILNSNTFESKRFPHHCFKEIKNGKSLIFEPYEELILKTLITRSTFVA